MSQPTLDARIEDFEQTRAVLHRELICAPQKYGDQVYYHLELPSESKFFRVGRREYVFLSLLDGEVTFAQALTLSAQVLGVEALTRQQAHQCYHWLLEHGLAKLVDAKGRRRASPARSQAGWRRFANPFWMQIPLLRPDRWLAPSRDGAVGSLPSGPWRSVVRRS